MKKLFYSLSLVLLSSCYYHDLNLPVCYIQSETLDGVVHNYGYNDKNELVMDSYPGDNAVMTYDSRGRVVTETDDPDTKITYTYNDKNQLIQMDAVSPSDPLAYNWEAKYSYNSSGQLIKIETWLYSGATSALYFDHYETLEYPSSITNNYSVRKRYDAYDNLMWTYEYFWDTNPNPHLRNPYFSNEPPTTNNLIQLKFQHAGSSTVYSSYYEYNYNEKGFPIRMWNKGNIISTLTYTNCN